MVAACLLAVTTSAAVAQQPAPIPEGAKAYVLRPPDGQVIRLAFWIRMGLAGVGIAPAGIEKPGIGHHHILVDAPLPPLGDPIPDDSRHLYFGHGQTETLLSLPPGRHTLQLLMADADQVPYDPPVMSRQITVLMRADGRR